MRYLFSKDSLKMASGPTKNKWLPPEADRSRKAIAIADGVDKHGNWKWKPVNEPMEVEENGEQPSKKGRNRSSKGVCKGGAAGQLTKQSDEAPKAPTPKSNKPTKPRTAATSRSKPR